MINFKLFVLLLTLFIPVANMTITLMAGLYIVYDLGGDQYVPIYSVAFFGVGNALSIPLSKYVGDRFGYRITLKGLLILYGVLSLLLAVSTNYPEFLMYRFFEGIVCGPFYILVPKIVPNEISKAYSTISMYILSVAPALGASYGGIIAYLNDWRNIFLIGSIMPFFLAFFLPKESEEREKPVMDIFGYFLYALSIFSLSFVFITGELFDWYRSTLLNYLFVIGVLSLLFFIIWNKDSKNPIIPFIFLKDPLLTYSLINFALLTAIYFGSILLLGTWLALYVHYDYIWISVLVATMCVSGLIPVFISKNKNFQLDVRMTLFFSLIFFAITSFHSSLFNIEVDFPRIILSRITAGFGLSFLTTTIVRLFFKSYEPIHTVSLSIYYQVVRSLSAGVGAALFVILWQVRRIFYHDRLAGTLNPFSESVALYKQHLKEYQIEGTNYLVTLEMALERQSTALALEDVFYFMGWLVVGLMGSLFLTLFIEKKRFVPENCKPIRIL